MVDYNTIPEVFRDWIRYCDEAQKRSDNTLSSYISDAEEFARYINGRRSGVQELSADASFTLDMLSSVTEDEICSYEKFLEEIRKLRPASVRRRFFALNSLFRYYYAVTGQLSRNPMDKLTPVKVEQSRPPRLTNADASKLLKASEGKKYEARDTAILTLFINCGLRVSELHALNLADLEKDRMHIRGSNRSRTILYTEEVKKQVRSYLDIRYALTAAEGHEDALFLSDQGKRLSVRRIHSMVDERLRSAGLDNTLYSAGRIRGISASLLLENGIDINLLKDIIGSHGSLTTQLYIQNGKPVADINKELDQLPL